MPRKGEKGMPQITAAFLKAKREALVGTINDIARIRLSLGQLEYGLVHSITDYHSMRVKFVREKLAERNVSWCTRCHAMQRAANMRLIFTQGHRVERSGHLGDGFDLLPFSRLYRACLNCTEELFERHGEQKPYRAGSSMVETFYVFHVEQRDDGLYVCRDANGENWVEIDEASYGLPENPPDIIIEQIATDFGLPDSIHIQREPGRPLVAADPPRE